MDPEAELELRRVVDNFVSIYEQLGHCEGPHVKPNYSYTELAYLAMLRSPNFCLPITEIYRYIQSRFLFFKNSTRKHWKNAVRHSLAKTMCFSKIPRGKGPCSENQSRSQYLWCIIPNSITSFARGDYRPGVDKESGTNTLRWGFYRVNAGQFWDQVGDYISARMDRFKEVLRDTNAAGKMFENQICVLPNQNQPVAIKQERQPLQPMMHPKNDVMVMRNQQQNGGGSSCAMASVSPLHPHAQGYQSRQPELDAHFQNQPFLEQSGPSPVHDPWMPRGTSRSPDTSLCSLASDQVTPPRFNGYESRDSGNETYESSPEGSYYKFLPSCQQQSPFDVVTSPQPMTSRQCRTPCDDVFDQIELSPFGESDLSQLCASLNESYEQPRLQVSASPPFAPTNGRNSCKFSTPVMSPPCLFQQQFQVTNNVSPTFCNTSFDFTRSCTSPLYQLPLEPEITFPAITGWYV